MRSRATAPMSAIIADDEQLAREELKFLLDQIGDVEVVAVTANGLEALEAIERLDPALAFLDIQMPGLDGLSVVRRLREQNIEPPHVIFSTAYEQFAVEAFRLEAMDYLLKPVERERLEETINRARRMVADRITEPATPSAARSNPGVHEAFAAQRNAESDRGSAGIDLRNDRQRRDHTGYRTGRRPVEFPHAGRTGRARSIRICSGARTGRLW